MIVSRLRRELDATDLTRPFGCRSGRVHDTPVTPRVDVTHDGGQHTALPVWRTDGRLRLDLEPVSADRVERLEVG